MKLPRYRSMGRGPDNDHTARKHFIWIFVILAFGIAGLIAIIASLLL
jgi:hypothetical protein